VGVQTGIARPLHRWIAAGVVDRKSELRVRLPGLDVRVRGRPDARVTRSITLLALGCNPLEPLDLVKSVDDDRADALLDGSGARLVCCACR